METNFKLFLIFIMFVSVASLPTDTRSSLDMAYDPSIPNVRAGKQLKEWSVLNKEGNPEEQGGYFEGDIIIDVEGRNGIISDESLWKGGKIPYVVKGSFSKCEKIFLKQFIKIKKICCSPA